MSKTTNKFSLRGPPAPLKCASGHCDWSPIKAIEVPLVRTQPLREDQHASRWQAVMSISAKIGCTPRRLNGWVKKAEVDRDKRAGLPADMAERMKILQ